MLERHLVERLRTERQTTERTYGRKTSEGQMTEKNHEETDIWPKRYLTQKTRDRKKIGQKPIKPYNI